MFTLSTNAKEAIKIALAMTLAYYFAMRLQWANPTWAAISVSMISLPTAGQSLNKGALRMAGTLLALVVGLFYLGLFPQDRWFFFLAFTPYLAFVTYKMTGKGGQYFWFVAAFVSMMITTAGPGSSEHAFNFAMFRTLDTLLGIVVWTLVSVFIWPRSNLGTIETIGTQLLETEGKLVRAFRDSMAGPGTGETAPTLRASAGKLESALEGAIGAAASESYEVREVRHLWDHLRASSLLTIATLDRLRTSTTELGQIDLHAVLPDLEALLDEVEARFEQASHVLGGAAPVGSHNVDPLSLDEIATESLGHFHRAAVEVARNELDRLEALSRETLGCVQALRRHDAEDAPAARRPDSARITGPFGLPPLDPDRIRATIMVVVSMWIASLVWIYVDPPGHISWYQFVPNLALVAAQTPQMRFTLLKPMTYAYLVGLAVYVFVMPQLSMFLELGLVIFAFTWVAAYFFSGVSRVALYLGMFNMFGVQNEQTYDFAQQANTLLFTVLAIALVVALTYITRSPRQEKEFMSMLSRFFRSCEVIVSWAADPTRPESILERARRAYHLQELRSLPAKLATWGGQIDHDKFPRNTAERTEAIVASVRILAYRVEDLLEARRAPQASLLVRELRDDVRAWRVVIERGFKRWSEHPEAESAGDLRGRLSARMDQLNARVEETLDKAGEADLSDKERANFYQLLGSLRGLTEVGIAYAGRAGDIDWAEWREERFF